jgi:hypothetical protein
MPAYSFKKDTVVNVVYGGNSYNIDISEVNFSQTLQSESYSSKTLQESHVFEGATVFKANPADFELTFPALREDDLRILFDRALDCNTFDLYISTQQDTFKLEYCVITNARFIIEKLKPLSMTVSGEASMLSRVGDSGYSIPGTPVSRAGSRTYNRISDLNVLLSGTDTLSDGLAAISVELQNKIEWTPYNIVPESCGSQLAVSYPSDFAIKGKILAGTITQYLTDTNNSNLLSFNNNTSLNITAGQNVGGTVYGFELDMSNCAFTNRLNPGQIYTQSFDWRLIQNPANLSDIITYTTL